MDEETPIDLWDKDYQNRLQATHDQQYLKDQNELAKRSDVFATILNYERTNPEEVGVTNDPKSMVRNAMMSRAAYKNGGGMPAWEEDLRTSHFYAAAFEEEQEIAHIRRNAGLDG